MASVMPRPAETGWLRAAGASTNVRRSADRSAGEVRLWWATIVGIGSALGQTPGRTQPEELTGQPARIVTTERPTAVDKTAVDPEVFKQIPVYRLHPSSAPCMPSSGQPIRSAA
jgi:hypothetical protein